ncbi:sterile alpha motif domain-containing protein 9-like [Thunnus maccoyii]|uniref:sterile alpha motif domain-containing protein 9-like n=1 Tax=Thunnus maccoyii TaxID=8240 RepID=UPI001C4CFDF3|nr:sterile alpha motif domain-containing protein 9-like [Thunnus maccoyii]
MEHSLAETPHTNETCSACGDESGKEKIEQYAKENCNSTNTQLFSFLALLNAYIPESYLLMSECQQILGPPDPIHGGPPFEERMKPFTPFINTSSPNPECVCMVCPVFAEWSLTLLANSGITRSTTVKELMFSLCGDQPEQHIIQFIKDLLTKREIGERGQEKFSRLIQDIQENEIFSHAFSVLTTASQKFEQNAIFPQTISRLNYISRSTPDYHRAEVWAKRAIKRAPDSSHVADTLGQIHKNRLLREAKQPEGILDRADKAFKAFKDVEKKAEKEEGPEMMDTTGTVSTSNSFNNRGLFGFMQVAKITYEKLSMLHKHKRFFQDLKMEVEDKFDFFEWYLTYSKPDMTTLEPSYFWKDVVLCYEYYTHKKAAESTSFPGLLDRLNHGLFTSKGRRAGFEEDVETVSDLEATRDVLKTTYEANIDDVKAAKRYILSNIILSNKMPNSPQLTQVRELKIVLQRFMDTEVGRRSPEYYLLVLLLFWPEEHPQEVQEEEDEEEEQATEDDGSEGKTWEDENNDGEQETAVEPAQLPLDLILGLDLQQYVTFMEDAFERAKYAKYLRGRYLLPLFFLGKGCGLCKWVHKSRLDAVVEEKVDAELANGPGERSKEKWERINTMWSNGDVWQFPEIQDILLPVQVEPCQSPTIPLENNKQEVFVCAEGKKIKATIVVQPDAPAGSTMLFYLGFTIQGPVVFKVGIPHY